MRVLALALVLSCTTAWAQLPTAAEPERAARLTVADAPYTAGSAVLISLGAFMAACLPVAVGFTLRLPSGTANLAGGIEGAMAAMAWSFGPNLGDWMNGDSHRIFTHGLTRLAMFGAAVGTAGLAVAAFPVSAGIGAILALVSGLAGFSALIWGLFDAVDSGHSPKRWLERAERTPPPL